MHAVPCRKSLQHNCEPHSRVCRNLRLQAADSPDNGGLAVAARRSVKRNFGGGGELPLKATHRQRKEQQQRQPVISPLPYWCEAVAVVGLPGDELVFCFHTPRQAAAAARRELRPEGAYGLFAVKLAALPSAKVSAILDRWQYACARQELAKLDCRPLLWWRYQAAVKGLANTAAAVEAAARGPARLNRRQRRLAARLAAEAQAQMDLLNHDATGSSSSNASSDASSNTSSNIAGSGSGSTNGSTNGSTSLGKGSLEAAEQAEQRYGQQQRCERPRDEQQRVSTPQEVHPEPQWQGRVLEGRQQNPLAEQQAQLQKEQLQQAEQQQQEQPWQAEQKEKQQPQQAKQQQAEQQPVEQQPVEQQQHAEQPRQLQLAEQQQKEEAASTSIHSGVRMKLLSWLAAAAAHIGAVLRRLPRLGASAAVSVCLALYRRLLPVWFRRLLWQSWPPQVAEAHVSPSLAAFLANPACSEARLRAGFNAAGQCNSPLADLPRWRIEALTLCRVRDIELYRKAFTHKMALPPALRLEKSFERLEFLGDSVLGLTCRTLLMRRLPARDEGDMTRQNSRLVSGASNARRAEWLCLDRYLLLDLRGFGLGEQHKPAILSDAFEALLGALYLDQGFHAAQRFCMRVLDACVEWEEVEGVRDYKALLCRKAAAWQMQRPRFLVRNMGQREYKAGLQLPWWCVDVSLKGRVMGSGGSFDKRNAEQIAARCALEQMGKVFESPSTG